MPRSHSTPVRNEWDHLSVETAVLHNDVTNLPHAIVATALNEPDWRYAQDLCVRLSSHSNASVQGTAVLCFGHIARIHQQLDKEIVQPIIQAALRHSDSYVQGQAHNAADDTTQFLGWQYG